MGAEDRKNSTSPIRKEYLITGGRKAAARRAGGASEGPGFYREGGSKFQRAKFQRGNGRMKKKAETNGRYHSELRLKRRDDRLKKNTGGGRIKDMIIIRKKENPRRSGAKHPAFLKGERERRRGGVCKGCLHSSGRAKKI